MQYDFQWNQKIEMFQKKNKINAPENPRNILKSKKTSVH